MVGCFKAKPSLSPLPPHTVNKVSQSIFTFGGEGQRRGRGQGAGGQRGRGAEGQGGRGAEGQGGRGQRGRRAGGQGVGVHTANLTVHKLL